MPRALPSLLASTFAAGMAAGLALTLIVSALRPAPAAPPDSSAVPPSMQQQQQPALAGAYRADIIRVIDGDTVEARVQLWLGHDLVTRVRLKDIDAPEMSGACAAERGKAMAARDRLAALVQGQPVVLAEIRPDKYFGRVVARVVAQDGADVAQALLGEGLARPYRGGKRGIWCDLASR